jgi:tetratricopeptide (TPR) repeat protein
VAAALERLAAPERTRHAAELADHLLQAGEGARALPYLLQAGDQAEALYAHAQAEERYRTAAQVANELGDQSRAAEALEKLGVVYAFVGRYDEALEACSSAAESYSAIGDVLSMRRITVRSADIIGSTGDLERGRALLQPLLDSSVVGEPASSVAEMYWTFAWLCSDPLERLAACERAAEIAREIGDHRILIEAEFARSNTLLVELGRIEEARRALHGIIPFAEARSEVRRLCSILNLLADADIQIGDFRAAQISSDRALALTDRVGAPIQLAWTYCNHGLVAYYAGDWRRAFLDFETADSIYSGPGRMADLGQSRWCMALVLLAQGKIKDASRLLEGAIALAEAHEEMGAEILQAAQAKLAERDLMAGEPRVACARIEQVFERLQARPGLATRLLPLLAWAYLELGDMDRAEHLGRDALTSAEVGQQKLTLVEAWRTSGMIAIHQQRWSDAQTMLERSVALSQSMSYPYAEARALYTIGLMHLQQGQLGPASQCFRAAQDICIRLGEHLYRRHITHQLRSVMQS